MKRAYSYQRFSSIKQGTGDSIKRQTEATLGFCKRHNLTLLTTFKDEGVSGFKGKNFSNESALSAFLKLVENGSVEKNSVLVVENMDRLSRQSILPCLSKFIEIINKGVSVGVISQDKILDEKSITENPMELMLVLVEFARANNESETKSKRLKSVIRAKIERAQKGEKVWFGVHKPSWIVGLKNGKWILDNERVKIVMGVFKRYLAGDSTNRIADQLNQAKTPTLRTYKDAKTNDNKLWTNTTVAELLRNKNVIGWFGINGVEINNYFPPIISEKDFLLTQHKLNFNVKNRGGSKYGLVRNLFKGLLFCKACGQVIETKIGSYANVKGHTNHYAHYICRGVKNHSGCTNKGRFNVAEFETDIFAMVLEKMPSELLEKPKAKKDSLIEILHTELLRVNADINDTVALIGKVPLPQLETKLATLQKRQSELQKTLQIEQSKDTVLKSNPETLKRIRGVLTGNDLATFDKAVRQLPGALRDTKTRLQLRNMMPDIIGKIELDFIDREYVVTLTDGKRIKESMVGNYDGFEIASVP